MWKRSIVPVLSAFSLLVACGDDGPASPSAAPSGSPSAVAATTVLDGLDGPTQISPDGSGGFVVAELNGSELGGTGRVLRFSSLEAEPEVLVDGLLTPTGVAVADDLLWIMERRTLSVAPLATPGDRAIVLDDLPYNGRSEGTISAAPGGGVLFDTSGERSGDELAEGSGTLWFLAAPDAEPEVYATGFKHAYAHTPTGDGRWFVTEVSDGRLNGGPPPDELVIAAAGDDFGYPRCIGDNEPVTEFGVGAEDCEASPRSHAVLPPRSTPTGVAVAPWDPTLVLVALWGSGEVVAVPAEPGAGPHDPVVVVDSVERPQHLLADGDRVLLVDHADGRILALAPTTG